MEEMIKKALDTLYIPPSQSHKGQNGRLLIIGGSKLFHAASLWALKVGSRIVDLVHYSSVVENNRIVSRLKEEFRDGIIIERRDLEYYVAEDDCILIGPGMVREDSIDDKYKNLNINNISEIEKIGNEGIGTYLLTKFLLLKYPSKKWVIDAGALQMMDPSWIPENSIITPHHKEFEGLVKRINKPEINKSGSTGEKVRRVAELFKCLIIHKGETDIVASKNSHIEIHGGNAGMTKGGTGDVLAGLVAALYTMNTALNSAIAGSYINKKAGEDLYENKGLWFNASDLAEQIPQTMKKLLL